LVQAIDSVVVTTTHRDLQVPRRRVAASGVSGSRELASFLIALLFASVSLLAAGALGLLIATAFYGYGGIA
jgi:hypothetical protein